MLFPRQQYKCNIFVATQVDLVLKFRGSDLKTISRAEFLKFNISFLPSVCLQLFIYRQTQITMTVQLIQKLK